MVAGETSPRIYYELALILCFLIPMTVLEQ